MEGNSGFVCINSWGISAGWCFFFAVGGKRVVKLVFMEIFLIVDVGVLRLRFNFDIF